IRVDCRMIPFMGTGNKRHKIRRGRRLDEHLRDRQAARLATAAGGAGCSLEFIDLRPPLAARNRVAQWHRLLAKTRIESPSDAGWYWDGYRLAALFVIAAPVWPDRMHEVTQILSAIEKGDPHATEQLLPLVYAELRKLAA